MIWSFLSSAIVGFSLLFHAPQSSETLAAVPVVEWLGPKEHDFGELKREHPVEYVFRFKNISQEDILLETVRTTCGCTAASWTETPIAPGTTGEVRIEYDAFQMGDFNKKIRVFFDKQRKAEILRITGSVK